MRITHILWISLSLAVVGCSKSAPSVSNISPSHGIQSCEQMFPGDFLNRTNVLARVSAFANQHSLPSQGRMIVKVLPESSWGNFADEAYGFGYLPCYTNVYFWVGFRTSPRQTMMGMMYCGTNDVFFHDYQVAFEQFIKNDFADAMEFVRTNNWKR